MKTKLIHFFQEGIWQPQQNTENKKSIKSFSINLLKILVLSVQGFIKDHGSLRASALTLYTLLSIVPIIAMCFGIAKGFGFEATLEQYIHS